MASAPPAERHRPDPADDYGTPGRSAWMDMDWSAHQRWVMVDGRPVNTIEIGEGPPLVFVHGHAGAWQNWLENIPRLCATHRVVAIDLPGFGWSPLPRERISVTLYARTLDAVCDRLDIDAAAVVGNSMGGFVGAEMAIRHPERVKRLVLVSAAGLSTRYIGLPVSLTQRRAALAAIRLVNRCTALPQERVERMARRPRVRRLALGLVARHPERISAPMAAYMIRGSGKPGAADAAHAIYTYDFRHRLPDIACPTLVVWGKRDFVVPPAGADEYVALIPGARKVMLEDTGHVPMIERPGAFNALLEDFLTQ